MGISVLVAGMAYLFVFTVWYPSPFAALAGGARLFLLLVLVDVVMGPVLTAVVASAGKLRRELVRDLSIIVVLQLAAFAYGIFSVALARPVALVFEVDLLRLVSAADIDPEELKKAPVELRNLSWSGPRLLAVVKPTDPTEQYQAIQLGLAGIQLAMLPKYWRNYDEYVDSVWRQARPVQALLSKYPESAKSMENIATLTGQTTQTLRFMPLLARQVSWVAVIAGPDAHIVGYLPFDGFF